MTQDRQSNSETITTSRSSVAEKKRLIYFDMVKGFAIICVILGHLELIDINRFVYTFHMPLFLIVSGYFFNEAKPLSLRLKSLLKPYIFTVIVLAVLGFVAMMIDVAINGGAFFSAVKASVRWLIAGVIGIGMWKLSGDILMPAIGAIWFLLALGWATIVVYAMVKMRWKRRYCLCVSIALYVLSCVSVDYFWLPLSVQPGLASVLFVYIGYVMKDLRLWESKWVAAAGCLMWVVAIWKSFGYNDVYSLCICLSPNMLIDTLGAIGGSIAIIAAAKYIERKGLTCKYLVLFGEASLVVLCFHVVELSIFTKYLWRWFDSVFDGGAMVFVLLVLFKLVWAYVWVKIYHKSPALQKIFR